MNHNYSFSFTIVFFFFFFLAHADYHNFADCNVPYECGELVNITYPFWGTRRPQKCGLQLLELTCINDTTILTINQYNYQVVHINTSSNTNIIGIQVQRSQVFGRTCPSDFKNETLIYPFDYSSGVEKLTLLSRCLSHNNLVTAGFKCAGNDGNDTERDIIYADAGSFSVLRDRCGVLYRVPVDANVFTQFTIDEAIGLGDALGKPFNLTYDYSNHSMFCDSCLNSGGICGTNLTAASENSTEFICYRRPDETKGSHLNLLPLKIVAPIVGTIILICGIIVFYIAREIRSNNDDQELEAIIRDCGPLPLKRYSFSDVKKITSSFKYKLGQGGYGCVYKGKQLDGRLVAVKVLNKTKGNGQEFMNEVLSISKTSHVNIVTLLGFCLAGRKRALVYEFMSNGSLEKFIHNKSNRDASQQFLGWENLYQIAIKIAEGLDYLHRGCNTRILHFDIKPHNILLDENFCPKISDFGLAKLCAKKESIVSMHEMRGTIGYIAPEMFSRNFGGVSHKSDVYSYGMMILEMVGARNNTNITVESSSETYFPHWIYKRLEEGNDLGLNGGAMTELGNEAARKMVMVGLWCIQTDPSQRPNISGVLDMLKGSVENLQVPPRPFVASPSRSLPLESFSSSIL